MFINQRVKMNEFTGKVVDEYLILVSDALTVVFDIEWDGNPSIIPAKFKDESGSDKSGYKLSDLEIIL